MTPANVVAELERASPSSASSAACSTPTRRGRRQGAAARRRALVPALREDGRARRARARPLGRVPQPSRVVLDHFITEESIAILSLVESRVFEDFPTLRADRQPRRRVDPVPDRPLAGSSASRRARGRSTRTCAGSGSTRCSTTRVAAIPAAHRRHRPLPLRHRDARHRLGARSGDRPAPGRPPPRRRGDRLG